jgi:hypothetical protein
MQKKVKGRGVEMQHPSNIPAKKKNNKIIKYCFGGAANYSQIFDFRRRSIEHNSAKSKGRGYTGVFLEKMRKIDKPAVRLGSVVADLKSGTS